MPRPKSNPQKYPSRKGRGRRPAAIPSPRATLPPPRITHLNVQGRRSSVRPDLYLTGLARKIGVSRAHLGRVLRGIGSPSLRLAQKLAGALGITIEQLSEQISRAAKSGR